MIIRHLGKQDYADVYQAMVWFADSKEPQNEDELWVLEHNPVYTVGRRGDMQHLLVATPLPVIRVDRGGEITFHGPGQLIIYTLLNFSRLQLAVGVLVRRLAAAIISTLGDYGIIAAYEPARPGVYVGTQKIASLGLRIRNNHVYHGISLNVGMDLTAFRVIDPCGYPGLVMTDMKTCLGGNAPAVKEVAAKLLTYLTQGLVY